MLAKRIENQVLRVVLNATELSIPFILEFNFISR